MATDAQAWDVLFALADKLGIDPEEARKADGKPSDVFMKHIERRDALMKAEALAPLSEKYQRDAEDAEAEGDVTAQLHWLLVVMHIEILRKRYLKQAENQNE